MKKYLIIFITFFLSSCSNGQIKNAVNDIQIFNIQISVEQSQLIFDKVKTFPNNTELSIAIVYQENVKYFGIKRVNDTIRIKENYQKIFEIGSISKVFTSTLLSSFVIDKKLDLEDAIQNYTNFKIKINDRITFKQLANHTSGLPRLPSNLNLLSVDKNNPYKNYDSHKLNEYLKEQVQLKQKPGKKHEYSNLGAGLLGYKLAEISNSTYESLLQKNIFEKYKMFNSTSKRSKIKSKVVSGLNEKGKATSNWDFDALVGCGGILSTVEDLSKFAQAQFDERNKELIFTQKPTFKINEHISIGLGWFILNSKKNNKLIWHNGGTGGYTSSIALNTKTKNGVVILSNVSALNKEMKKIDELCFQLIKTLDDN